MKPSLQRWVQRNGWDRASHHYEEAWRRQLRPAVDLLLATAQLRPGEDVIDVACGTGLATVPAAVSVGPAGRVLGLDVAPKMVDRLRRTAAAADLGNIDVGCCDAQALETDDRFDVALCSLGLMYVPESGAALGELHRVLRPDGRVVVSVWGERRNCGWAGVFPVVESRVASDVCPLFFALGAPRALGDALDAAGFVDVADSRLAVDLVYSSADEALAAAFLAGPVALAYSRFDEPTRRSAHDEYLDSIAVFAHGAGYRIPGEFVVATGRRPLSTTDQLRQQPERQQP